MMYIFLSLAILFFALALLAYLQKIDSLIAGYNTMSEQEKMKINRNTMNKGLAITFALTGVICLLGFFSVLSFSDTTMICVAIIAIGSIVVNIISKKKD